jgi:hypothetical protein
MEASAAESKERTVGIEWLLKDPSLGSHEAASSMLTA